jgi:phosphomannomutase
MLSVLLNILSKALDLFPKPDGSELLPHADDQSIEELANTHVDKEIWKKLKEAERQKIRYLRKLKKTTNKAKKLKKKGITIPKELRG